QEIIVTQREEIAEMRLALASVTPSPSTRSDEAPFLARNDAAMAKMMAGMKIKPSHDVDKDFVTLMVPHHRGAIDMAAAELSYGYNESLRGLAQEIIATQEQQIAAMRRMLNEPFPPAVLPPHQRPSGSRRLLFYYWMPRQSLSLPGGLT
ncbi:MAG TPA: DUF305 domain-containing protein, partial [Ktedonobacteraceae bacterium]|nr:DUF305 domain-containing protein [Ktedonobacteraceae bacterium]